VVTSLITNKTGFHKLIWAVTVSRAQIGQWVQKFKKRSDVGCAELLSVQLKTHLAQVLTSAAHVRGLCAKIARRRRKKNKPASVTTA